MGLYSDAKERVSNFGSKIEDGLRDVGSAIDDGVHDVGSSIDDVAMAILAPGFAIPQKLWGGVMDWLQPDIPGVDIPSFSSPANSVAAKTGIDLANRIGTSEWIPVPYGRVRTGGIMYPLGVSGVDNNFLHIIIIIGEGQIDDVEDIYFDDVLSTDPRFYGYFIEVLHTGADNQFAESELTANIPGWSSQHIGAGIAYQYLRLSYDPNVWNGLPRINLVVRGKKLYDPRNGSTVWSNNPSLVLRDYFLSARYGRGLVAGDLDQASFNTVADYCDQQIVPFVADVTPPTIKRWTFDGIIDTSRPIYDNIVHMCTALRAYPIYVNGLYRLMMDKDETPTHTLTKSNLIGGWTLSHTGMTTRYNRIDVSYVNAQNGYQADIARHDSTIFRTDDNGRMLLGQVEAPFLTNYYRALNYGELALKQSRQNLACAVKGSPETLQIEPGEVIYVTHDVPGFVNKKFRVIAIEHEQDGTCNFELAEHDSTVYNLDDKIEAPEEPDTNLPNPDVVIAPSALALSSGTEQLLIGSDGTVISRIKATWVAPPDIYVIGYETEWKRAPGTVYHPGPTTSSRTSVEAYLSPAEDGIPYDVRVRAINSRSKVSPWLETLSYFVIGKTEPPPPVTGLLVTTQSDGTRQFIWTYGTPPPDLAGFECRYLFGTSATWETMSRVPGAEHLSPLTRLFESNQLPAGGYIFAIKAFDTSGNYSTNAMFVQSTIGDPRLRGQLYTQSARFNSWESTAVITSGFVNGDGDIEANDTGTWTTLPATWDAWATWYQTPVSPVIYEGVTIDLGAVYKFTPLISINADGAGTVTINHSLNNTTWSGFITPPSSVNARYLKIKASVATTSAYPVVIIRDVKTILSVDYKEETIEDLTTSTLTGTNRIGVGDIRLPILKTYTTIKNVGIALQNVGSGWSWEIIDKNVSPGPRVVIWNGAVKADAVIDAKVEGI